MARDAELDRIKTAQDLAFQRKQDAYKAQDHAWQRRSSARDALSRAHEEKQRTYAIQDASWQDYQRVRSSSGPRIDHLNAQQEAAFENMKRAFDNASSAHERRDGAGARSYADEGHRYKAESQGYVAERRRLVEEIRTARAGHEVTKPAFQHAKDQFSELKRSFDQAKADHERAQAEFKRAKAEFDQAAQAFKKRLEVVRSESNRRKDDKRSIAERAGVPLQYRDNVWVSKDLSGSTNIYFGGVGEPNGPGHGHYAMDSYGTVTYKRDPFDPHGAQNFADEGRGSTMYDRSARSGSVPTAGSGEHRFRGEDVGTGHFTQAYADGYRLSRDTDGTSESDVHWINQNVSKGKRNRAKRQTPPSDALE